MRVHDRADVRTGRHHLGVDRVLSVAAALALHDLPVARDEEDLLRADFLEAVGRRLHPDPAAVGVAGGDVAPHEIALVLESEHAAAERDLVAQRGDRVAGVVGPAGGHRAMMIAVDARRFAARPPTLPTDLTEEQLRGMDSGGPRCAPALEPRIRDAM